MYGSLLALPYGSFAQAFTENFGSVSGTSSIATASVGFANGGFIYTGTADVRNTSPSTGYTGASGNANIFITNTSGRFVEISGINTATLTPGVLNFGISKSTNASTGADLLVEASVNGGAYSSLGYAALPTGSGTSKWYARTTTASVPTGTNVSIRFRQTGTATQYRIDDVQFGATGGGTTTPCTASITASGATTFCNGGNVVLSANSGASYLWSNGATTQTVSVSQSGTYNVTVTAVGGCTASAFATRVLVYPTPIVGGSATAICGSGTSTLTARTFAQDLFFSEYVEGSANNKYIEIFNGTGSVVNLSDYVYRAFQNGVSAPTFTLDLSTLQPTLGIDQVLVIRNPSSTSISAPSFATNAVAHNGNDALALYKVSTASYVDIFGVIGVDPIAQWNGTGGYSTLDKTLRRKTSVYSGITVNPSLLGQSGFSTLTTEWDLFSTDDVSGLGSHTMDGTYSWSAGTTPSTGNVVTASPPASNVYVVTGDYAVSGCSNTGTVQVNVFDAPSVVIDNGDVPVITQCYGPQCVNLTALPTGTTPFTYAWSTSETTAGIVVCPTVTTSFSVVATDVNGCTAIESINIVVMNTCCEENNVIVCTGTSTVCADSSAVQGLIEAGGYVGPCDTRKFISGNDDATTSLNNKVSAVNVYPNPFNEATMFEVKLSTASQVKIEILDITGKKVAELTNTMFASGTHQFNWNGTNAAGNAVSSGLYFCRIATGDQVQTLKIQKLSDK